MSDITIIGGGVAGLCVARELRDRGAELRVIDRYDGIGPHQCSWWAGGMLAPFCEGESAEEPVIRLGQEAAGWWQKNTGCVTQNGSLVLASKRDSADLTRFARRTSNLREVSGNEIAALEPDLGARYTRGLFFESEAHLSPRKALETLRMRLVADGVKFETAEADPETVSKKGKTIDCRGFSARDSLPDLRGVKGEMLLLSCPEVTLNRPIRLLHPRIPLYIVPRGDGIFMLGATMIESSATSHVTARSLLELLSAAYALSPAFGEAEVLEIGVDARPAFPDNLPRIREDGNVITANGLYRHGFLLAPALARMVAELVFDNTRPEVLDEAAA
ncbi:MAG: glycine oxidase ThiO [Litoreibacter sp.]|nr:glycine oxidase ThiO [Litoreibacter sp.]MCY4336004.1 glycine oxidase ThiO [Litoreibacter sp.]